MTLNFDPRQREILRAMGIDVWQLRDQGEDSGFESVNPITDPKGQPDGHTDPPGAAIDRAADWEITEWATQPSDLLLIVETSVPVSERNSSITRLLDSILFAMQCTTDDTRICFAHPSAAKSPDPQAKTMIALIGDLIEQVQPQVIIVFGAALARSLLETDKLLDTLRTEQYRVSDGNTNLLVTDCLEALLTDASQKALVWSDLERALNLLRAAR